MVVLLPIACGKPPQEPHAPADPAHVVWRYEVSVTPELDLDVDAELENARADTPLRVDEDAKPFLDSKETKEEGRRVRYRVRLAEAARKVDDVDVAFRAEGAVFAPPSTWLLRPAGVSGMGRFRFHITLPKGVAFATAVRAAKDGAPSTYEADVMALEDAGFSAFGAIKVERLPGTEVDVVSARGLRLSEASLRRWLTAETNAIGGYFGARDRVALFVTPGTSEATRGKTLGDGGASVLVRLGTTVTDTNLLEDWVLAHELVHVAMPQIPLEQAWFSEGLATYLEPVARVRSGIISPEKFWSDLVVGLPDGIPGPNDGGLDGTRDRGRLYWGGALYFLLADIAIRERTGGKRSLDDALRAIKRTGANVETHWTLKRVLDEGDRGTGTDVLSKLYEAFSRTRQAPDLEALFRRLGVRRAGETVTFEANAPLESLRKAITAPLPSDSLVR